MAGLVELLNHIDKGRNHHRGSFEETLLEAQEVEHAARPSKVLTWVPKLRAAEEGLLSAPLHEEAVLVVT